MKVFVSGSLAYDRIMDFPGKFEDHILPDKIHVLNVCFTVNGLKENFGGTAGNIAYTLSLLGESPYILATAGKDFKRYGQWLLKNDIPTDHVRHIREEFTAGAYITTDRMDNQITGFNPGAMKHPSLFTFDAVPSDGALFIIAPGNIEDMVSYTHVCRDRGIPFIFDPGQSIPALSGDQLSDMITGSQLLISNDYELEMIMRATKLDTDQILSRTGGLVTTLGEEGSVLISSQDRVTLPSAAVAQVRDPTGAGDAYRAGLVKGLALGRDLVSAARLGVVCAAYAVEQYGTQEHYFSQDAFWARYEATFGKE